MNSSKIHKLAVVATITTALALSLRPCYAQESPAVRSYDGHYLGTLNCIAKFKGVDGGYYRGAQNR